MRMKDSVFGLAVVFFCALPMAAQQSNTPPDIAVARDLDRRWLPWLGCWQRLDEQMDRATHESHEFDNASNFPDRSLVCVTPADNASGVKLATVTGGHVLAEHTLVADATARQVDGGNCQGWNRGEWSHDGHRFFTRAEFRCKDSPLRSHNGVSFMATHSTWVDIQLVDVGTHQHLEIRRYKPVHTSEHDELLGTSFPFPTGPSEILRARRENETPPTLLAVLDATEKTAARVVEAMLAETKPRFALTSAALIELDDAGLGGDAIDLLVALSYPDQFVVKRKDRPRARLGSRFGRFYSPIWYDNLYPYHVTPLGYRYWLGGYTPYFYGRAASPFIVLRNNANDDPSGRAISDRGYTRARPRVNAGVSSLTNRRGKGGSSTVAPRSGEGSASGGKATPSGYTRGGSPRGGGRAAVPRRQ